MYIANEIQSSRQIIAHLHAFRGFAIINIVAAHSWELPSMLASEHDSSLLLRLISALVKVAFHDSTLYFALISGLLFSLVLQKKGWTAFFKSKIVNIVSPYVGMTLLFTFVGWNIGGGPIFFDGSVGEYIGTSAINLIAGSGFFHLWYIPVLFCLYLITPAIVSAWRNPNLKWLAIIAILAPLVVSRTWPDQSIANIVYFLGAYVAGIVAGTKYDETISLLRRCSTTMWFLFAASTTLLLLRGRLQMGSIGITSIAESFWYVQKLSVAALVIPWMQAREPYFPDWLNTLATYAFPIYFLHGILIFAASGLFVLLDLYKAGAVAVALYGLATLGITLLICSVISKVLRRVLGRHSRMLVGI